MSIEPPELAAQLARFEAEYQAGTRTLEHIAGVIDTLQNANRADLLSPWPQRAYDIDPRCWFACFFLAHSHEIKGRHDLAVRYWGELFDTRPEIDPLQLRKAQALLRNRELDAAESLVRAALASLNSAAPATSLFYPHERYYAMAESIAERLYLIKGEHRGHVHRVTHLDGFYLLPNVPVWSGESVEHASLYISNALGYGDQVLFYSVIPQIAAHVGTITLSIDSHLENLLRPALPNVRLIPTVRPLTPVPAPQEIIDVFGGKLPDFQLSLLHLPLLYERIFPGRRLKFLPYLKVPQLSDDTPYREIAYLRTHNPHRKLIGISWSRAQQFSPEVLGGEGALHAGRTSLPNDLLSLIVDDPELSTMAHFVALHPYNEYRIWPDPIPQNLSVPKIRSGYYEETAAWMKGLDLIVTVDMVCATLSSLLDQETWLMMSFEGEWRWGQSGPRSVWIPNARTFRQPQPCDWHGMLRELIPALGNRLRRMQTVTEDTGAPSVTPLDDRRVRVG